MDVVRVIRAGHKPRRVTLDLEQVALDKKKKKMNNVMFLVFMARFTSSSVAGNLIAFEIVLTVGCCLNNLFPNQRCSLRNAPDEKVYGSKGESSLMN